MSLDLFHLFSPTYLFNLNPGPLQPGFFRLLVAAFVVMFIAGLIARRSSARARRAASKKLMLRLARPLTWLGVIGLLWVLFREQHVFFLSAPFWFLLWLIGVIAWLTMLGRYYFKRRPQEIVAHQEHKQKQKYLARKK